MNSSLKWLLIGLGTMSLALGAIGILIPGLPTTPFLLLAAGLYLRSSERLYQGLLANRFTGPIIKKYQQNKGMTIGMKLSSIGFMWVMISISVSFFIDGDLPRGLVILLGIIGTMVMGFLIPTSKNNRN
jgi:uncharacterized protein